MKQTNAALTLLAGMGLFFASIAIYTTSCSTVPKQQAARNESAPSPPAKIESAVVVGVTGNVSVRESEQEAWTDVHVGQMVDARTKFRTGLKSAVQLRLAGGGLTTIDRLGVIEMTDVLSQVNEKKKDEDKNNLGIEHGKVQFNVTSTKAGDLLNMKAPDATLAVQGTEGSTSLIQLDSVVDYSSAGVNSSTPATGAAPSVLAPTMAMGRGNRLFVSSGGLADKQAGVPTVTLDPVPASELWIIERRPSGPQEADAAKLDENRPRTGCLMAIPPGQAAEIAIPLNHTDVHAAIHGAIASVDVKQTFHNPYSDKIEASYIFPLPDNAAVNEFVMTIGDRHIRAIVRDRAEAEKTYLQARAQGYTASLLTQERPNIFTQKVANIEPGKSIDISIRYYNTLAYSDGGFDFVFPMVVGPRFNPPSVGTEGIGAAPRNQTGMTGQTVEVPYLRPGERTGHDISIAVDIDAGVAIEEVTSRTHAVQVTRTGPTTATVKLSDLDAVPNKDFVLTCRLASDAIKSGILTHQDSRGGFFTMLIVPPADLAKLQRSPVEMVFVVDRSGSMEGRPIEQARAAAVRGMTRLQEGDTFQVINFSDSASQLGAYTLDANPDNVRKGIEYVNTFDARGGTMMMNGLAASLDFPHDSTGRPRYVCFLTDGFIGNEAEILGALHNKLGPSRIFSFGMGSSVNRYLINHMARVGKGAAGYVTLADSPEEVMDTFFDRVSHPALSDLKIDWGGAEVSDVYPSELPDLLVGRPVIITGRINGEWKNPVRISGRAGNSDARLSIAPPQPSTSTAESRPAIASIWARARIADLADQSTWRRDAEIPARIKQTALDYALMSAYTAMVAVDSLNKTAGEYGTTVRVPVPTPDGVRYETTVPGGG